MLKNIQHSFSSPHFPEWQFEGRFLEILWETYLKKPKILHWHTVKEGAHVKIYSIVDFSSETPHMKGKKFWSYCVCSAGILHDRMSSNENKEETGLKAVIDRKFSDNPCDSSGLIYGIIFIYTCVVASSAHFFIDYILLHVVHGVLTWKWSAFPAHMKYFIEKHWKISTFTVVCSNHFLADYNGKFTVNVSQTTGQSYEKYENWELGK